MCMVTVSVSDVLTVRDRRQKGSSMSGDRLLTEF